MDDDRSSIVGTIRLGRRIYDNIGEAITCMLAVHVPSVGLPMVPVMEGD
jgi:Ca2+-transporting ATPase